MVINGGAIINTACTTILVFGLVYASKISCFISNKSEHPFSFNMSSVMINGVVFRPRIMLICLVSI